MTKEFDMDLPEESKSVVSELIVTAEMLKNGEYLIDVPLPDNTLVVMVKRGDRYFVPNGCTPLSSGDKLLIISDNEKELKQAYEKLGIENYILTSK